MMPKPISPPMTPVMISSIGRSTLFADEHRAEKIVNGTDKYRPHRKQGTGEIVSAVETARWRRESAPAPGPTCAMQSISTSLPP